MKPSSEVLFNSDLWTSALEKYARDTHLSVKLFDADGCTVFGPIHSTPFYKLFEESGFDPGIFTECARRCLTQTNGRPAVLVSEFYGLTAVGTSLMLDGKIVGAAVGGYAFVDFSQVSEIHRLAKSAGIRFERLWEVAREQKPVPQRRLMLNGELLQVLGDALLRENYRTRQYEDIVRKLQEALHAKDQADRQFREQADELRKVEKMAAAGRLAASISHEINNPLSSLTNVLYLLESDANLGESARGLVTTAASELARVSRIVKQSLSYYRVGTTPRDLDLSAVVNESLAMYGTKFQGSGVEVKTRLDRSMLVGFPDELRQVIDNLLLNALEAMPRGGRLTISVHRSFNWRCRQRETDRKGVRLTIADSGCGISKQDRARLFEPFFSTKAEKGSGLGLWVLQGIVAKHDGSLSVRSSDAKGKSGTIISIFLPSSARSLDQPKPAKTESGA